MKKSRNIYLRDIIIYMIVIYSLACVILYFETNVFMGFTYLRLKNNYILLSVVTTLILAVVVTSIFLIAFIFLDSKISKFYEGDSNDYIKLLKKLIIIICVIILLFGVFKGYTGLSRVNNFAVINFFNNGIKVMKEKSKDFKIIHIISTTIYSIISALVVFIVGRKYLKKLSSK